MRNLILFFIIGLSLILGGCASESPWGLPYRNLTKSDCLKERSNEEIISRAERDTTYDHLLGVSPFTVSITTMGGRTYFELKNIEMICLYSCVPHVEYTDSVIRIAYEINSPNCDIFSPCFCRYDIAFETDAIPDGQYRLIVSGQDFTGTEDIPNIVNSTINIYSGEPSINTYYVKYNYPIDLNAEEIKLLDKYFSMCSHLTFDCIYASETLGLF